MAEDVLDLTPEWRLAPRTPPEGADRPEAATATRLAILRALGPGARLSVAQEGRGVVYRAVDERTGETRQTWREAEFLRLIRGVRADVFADIDGGHTLPNADA